MATPISRRKEEIELTGQINKLKKRASDLDDKEIRDLQAKEKRLKSIKKEHAAVNKVREEGEMKVFTLMSRVESLQKDIGKVIIKSGKATVKWSNAAHQTGIATLGIKNTTESVAKTLGLFPGMMSQFGDAAANVTAFMGEGSDRADQLLQTMRDAGGVAGTMVDFRTKEGKATRDAVATWGELKQIVGQTVTEMVTGLGDTIESSKKLLINFDEIGTGSFSDMVGEMEKQERLAERNLELWEERKVEMESQQELLQKQLIAMGPIQNMTKEQRDLYDELNKQLEKSYETMAKGEDAAKTAVKNAKVNVDLAKEQKVQHQQIAAAVDAVSAPFVKLKSAMEALPFGNLISSAIDLDGAMNSFKDSATDAFKKVQAGTMTEAQALQVVTTAAQTMIKTLVTGLKLVAKTMLANPILILVVVLMAAVAAMKKLYGGTLALRKEMGLTFGHAAELQKSINMTATQFSFLGVEASDVQSIVAGIQSSMGGVGEVTDELLESMARLNADFGIAGESAAILVTQMKAVGAASDQAAISQLESVGYLAQASGVAPAAIMNSVAGSSEAFAGFAKDGGKNMFKAAIAAKKLGVEFSSIVAAAEGLLDFESSIEASMEASMLLGRNINTDLARQMAFTGDIEGMQREILRQAGSQADFEKMNVLQRKALAKAFGLSVSEMSSMISNQEKLNNMTAGEKRTRDQINDLMEKAGKVWAQILSLATKLYPVILGIGGAIAIAFLPLTLWGGIIAGVLYGISKLVDEFEGAEYVIGAIVGLFVLWKLLASGIHGFGGKSLITSIKEWAVQKGITKEKQKQVVADVAKNTTETTGGGANLMTSAIPNTETVPKKGIGDKLKDLAQGLKAMAGGKVLQGALNLIPTGLGFLLLLPGLPGLLILGRAKLSKIGINLIQLGLGLAGMAGKKVAMGALNMTLAAVAFTLAITSIPFLGFIAVAGAAAGTGLRLLGIGLQAIGKAASTGYAFLGPLLIAALGVAMIPFAYALKLAAPGITAVAEGLVILSSVGSKLPTLAVGIAAIGLALAAWGLGGTFIALGILLISALALGLVLAGKSASIVATGMKDINVEMEKTIKNKKQYQGFLEGFSKTMGPLKKLGKKLGESLWAGFGMAGLIAESPSRLGEKIRDGITAIMGGLLDSFGRLFDGIGKIFSGLLGFFGALWEGIKALAAAAWAAILAGAKWLWEGIKAVWEGIKAGAQAAWDGIKAGAQWAWEKVKAGWAGLKEALAPAWEGLKQGASTAWEGIKSGALSVWEGIKAGWDAGSFAPVWEGLKSGASQAWAGISEGAGQAWEGMKASAVIAAEKVKAVWSSTKEVVGEGWNKAKDLASQAWDKTKQAASTAWSSIQSIFGFASGGIVPKAGQKPQYFAQGTDTIPAMLTPGEMILNEDQQSAVFGGGRTTDTAALEAKVDRLIAAIESGNSQLSTIAGNTGEFADAIIR